MSRDEIFFWRFSKLKQYFMNERRWFSLFLAVFLSRKLKIKFLLASMKLLTDCENPSSNPLRGACSGVPRAACYSKSCSEIRLLSWKFRKPAVNVHWRKSINESKGKPEQKFNAASRTIFRTTVVRSKQKLYINFYLKQGSLKIKK